MCTDRITVDSSLTMSVYCQVIVCHNALTVGYYFPSIVITRSVMACSADNLQYRPTQCSSITHKSGLSIALFCVESLYMCANHFI